MLPPPRNIRHRRPGQGRGIIALPILEQSSRFRVGLFATSSSRAIRCNRIIESTPKSQNKRTLRRLTVPRKEDTNGGGLFLAGPEQGKLRQSELTSATEHEQAPTCAMGLGRHFCVANHYVYLNCSGPQTEVRWWSQLTNVGPAEREILVMSRHANESRGHLDHRRRRSDYLP
jgi:hypothetical protein